MKESEYNNHSGIRRSDLFKIGKSPLHFIWSMENPAEPTPALVFGQAFHKLALEPDGFADEFAIAPNVDRRTKEGKAEWADFLEMSAGKTAISIDDTLTISNMIQALRSNRYASMLIERGKHEVPFFWKEDIHGEDCKCRPDILFEQGGVNIIADLKSCASADTESFSRDMVRYGYDLQAWMYCEGVKANTGKDYQFVFIAVEKTPPYAVSVMQADEYVMMRGEALFREYIGIYHECKETGNWYGLNGANDTPVMLRLPAYLQKDFE